MSDRTLSLLVAGLFPPDLHELDAAPDLRALETALTRADRLPPGVPPGFEAAAFALFEVEPDSDPDVDLPVAAVTRALDIGVIDKGWWLRADPVHLQPFRDRLILSDHNRLDLTHDEAQRLAAEIMEVYSADGWLLKPARPGRWYLKPPRASHLLTTPLPEVVGKDIHPHLPRGKDGKSWHTVLNEIQILLHTAAVNVEREQAGKLPVNSLWFWGGGRLPNIRSVRWAEVWSEEPVSLALARLSEAPSRDLPTGFDEWQSQARLAGEHLVVIDRGRTAVQYGDGPAWVEFIQRFERNWIVPLLQALRSGELAGATLYSDTGRAFRLDRRSVRRWWRRRSGLAGFR